MSANQQVYGARQYGEEILNGISNQHGIATFTEKNPNSHHILAKPSSSEDLQFGTDLNDQDQTITPDNQYQNVQYHENHQTTVHQTVNVPLFRRVFHALFLMLTPFLIIRIIVFASVRYDLLPQFDGFNGLSGIIYQSLSLLTENKIFKPFLPISSYSSSASQIKPQALMVSNTNSNLEPTKVILISLSTAAAAIASAMATEPKNIQSSSNVFTWVFSKILKNEPKFETVEVTSPTISLDLETDMMLDESNADEKATTSENILTTVPNKKKPWSLVDRVSAILVNELGYRPEQIVTKILGHVVVVVYSFSIALVISFASLFYLLGIYLIVARKWKRLYIFFRGVVTNEMLVTEI